MPDDVGAAYAMANRQLSFIQLARPALTHQQWRGASLWQKSAPPMLLNGSRPAPRRNPKPSLASARDE